jgi:aspartate beta-hydroxylase
VISVETERHLGAADATTETRVAATLQELGRRQANLIPHGVGSLEAHLRGTCDILSAWEQPARVVLAGLLHSAYSTESFEHRLFGLDERALVRSLIGDDADHLVHLFCATERNELFAQLSLGEGQVTQQLRLASRAEEAPLTIVRREAGDLLVLHMANLAAQACEADGAPAPWLSELSALAQWASHCAERVPPVFDRCTVVVSKQAEEQLIESYDTALRTPATGPGGAFGRLCAAAENAYVAEPFIWLGISWLVVGDQSKASECAALAEARLGEWGTSWDKRRTPQQWRRLTKALKEAATHSNADMVSIREHLRAALQLAGGSPEQLLTRLEAIISGAEEGAQGPAKSGITSEVGALPARFQQYIAAFQSDHPPPRKKNYYPGLTARPWYDPQHFPLAFALERAACEIASELNRVDVQLFRDEAENIAREGRWSVLFLDQRGSRNKDVWELCPVTASIIDAHAAATDRAGVSYFSCLEPGTRVAPHRGPTNMRLRCHLGIDIPDCCGLKVGGVEKSWKKGRCLVFDDSFVHEVWNLSDRRRVVLIVDIWHPDLTSDELTLLKWVLT